MKLKIFVILFVLISVNLGCSGNISDLDYMSTGVAATLDAQPIGKENIVAETESVVQFSANSSPTVAPTDIPISTATMVPTATTVPTSTPLPTITDYEFISVYYPSRETAYIRVDLPGTKGNFYAKLNGQRLECEFDDVYSERLNCEGPRNSNWNTPFQILVRDTEHVALEFVVYLPTYEVATCGADVTGTWSGFDSWGYVATLIIKQYDCAVNGTGRYTGPFNVSVNGSVSGGVFSFSEDWGGCQYNYAFTVSGNTMSGPFSGCGATGSQIMTYNRN